MPYLIDGYNLLYATGRLSPRAGRGALEASRRWLLVELVRWHGAEASAVTVVFDAAAAPPGAPSRDDHGGVRVLFSRGESADDLIEELIGGAANPKALTVVSDDNRIKESARRRGCAAVGCLDYCESWQAPRAAPPSPPPEPAKPDRPTEEETRRWLEVFKDADDPNSDPF